MSNADQRNVPYDLQAEESLIGAVLCRPTIINELHDFVDAGDFMKPWHGRVWEAMLDMHDHGVPIDVVTVRSHLDEQVPGGDLTSLMATTPSVSNAGRYANLIVETSRRRRLLAHLAEMSDQCYHQSADEVLGMMDVSSDRLIARRDGEIDGLSSIGDFLTASRRVEAQGDWLIPHILRPRWRVVIVAGEGVGKGTFMRYLGLNAAAGRDAWMPTRFVTPRRVLYVDVENPDTTILHQINIANTQINLGAEADGFYHIWHREGGINLRDRRTRAQFERVLQQVRPEIVFAGPMYKMFRRGAGEDMEQATVEFFQVLDDFRTRYNFALVLEHHAPKGNGGGYREMNPFGSSAILRWPEFGVTLEVVGNPLSTDTFIQLDVGRFRRDREPADWPDQIERGAMGQNMAFRGRWGNGRNRQNWLYGDEFTDEASVPTLDGQRGSVSPV